LAIAEVELNAVLLSSDGWMIAYYCAASAWISRIMYKRHLAQKILDPGMRAPKIIKKAKTLTCFYRFDVAPDVNLSFY
jgi:hypothetical protein